MSLIKPKTKQTKKKSQGNMEKHKIPLKYLHMPSGVGQQFKVGKNLAHQHQ